MGKYKQEKKIKMTNFNHKKFKSLTDFIIGITKEIWENRQIQSILEYYSNDVIVRSPEGVVHGNKKVVDATHATLYEFPNRELLGEDVIWCKNKEGSYLSSHRILSKATHLNDGVYGKANKRDVVYRVIADCHVNNGIIDDEWLVRDQGAIVRQLGYHPKQFILSKLENTSSNKPYNFLSRKNNPVGPYIGRGNTNKYGKKFEIILKQIMNFELSSIIKTYDRSVQIEFPGHKTGHSYSSVEKFWMQIRESFPSSKFNIDHIIGIEDENMYPRASIRWSLDGKHDGEGYFGKPTGKDVYILGISHVEFRNNLIIREFTLFDELLIWEQILS